MDSINRNQPEENRQDLRAQDAVAKIREIVAKAENCFFCTAVSTGDSGAARPMNVRQADDEGNLWFLSAGDSHKNQELERDPSVRLFFQGSPHSDFLQLNGRASVSTDRAKIEGCGSRSCGRGSRAAWTTRASRSSRSSRPTATTGTRNTALPSPT